jgi:Carboxypeptidase regulatory-like domain/TonB dependent receptor
MHLTPSAFSRLAVAFFVVFALSLGTASAQISGSLTGTVEDATGGVAPGVQILILNQETGSKNSATTNGKGGFFVGDLESGLYTVTATKAGFRVSSITDIKVDTAKETSLPPIHLAVGAVTETVTVDAGAASLVNTSSADLSNTIYTQDINGLPLQDRNPLSMVTMQPGVSSASVANGGASTVNGLRPTDANMTLDGINIQDFVRTNDLNIALNMPFMGQVGEIEVTTSNADVSMGGGAAQVTMRTPSGSNTWHGEGFWENRINNLAANQWFNNADGVAKPRLLLNQFGGNFGGHIIKNKLFFYFFDEEYRLIQQTTNTDTILTPSARNGIFTYHETNGTLGTINLFTVSGYTADPSMAAIIAKLPAVGNSTTRGDGNNTTGFLLNRSENNNNNNVGGRIDYNMNAKNVINGTYSYNNNNLLRPDVDTTFSVTPAASQVVGTNFMSVGWRFTPEASLTNEVRFGFSRGEVAFKDSNTNSVPAGTFFISGQNFTNPIDTFQPQGRQENSYALLDNAIWNHGTHTVRFGVQSNLFHVYSYNSAGITPTYGLGFSTANTRGLTTTEFPGGVNSTDFANANTLLAELAGITSTATQTFNVTSPTSGYVNGATSGRHFPYDSLAAYVGDQWRIRRNLTLNYGVRWEYEGRFDESNGLILGPQIAGGNPQATLLSNATVNFIGGSAKQPTYNRDLHSFAPNIGIAWDPKGNGKTSIRAGYSLNYVNDNAILAGNNAAANNPGLTSSVSLAALTATLANKVTVGVPVFNEPQTFSQELANFGPTTATELINPNLATPYVQQWNITIQHELKGHVFVSASYVGNHGTKLTRVLDLNQTLLPAAYLTDFNNARSNGFLAQAAGLGFTPTYNPAVAGSVPLPYFATLASGGLLTNATVKSNIQLNEAGNLASVYVQSGLDNAQFLPNPNIFVADYLTNTRIRTTTRCSWK